MLTGPSTHKADDQSCTCAHFDVDLAGSSQAARVGMIDTCMHSISRLFDLTGTECAQHASMPYAINTPTLSVDCQA